MNKNFYSLGLMSGTSMDGIDASIIKSDGEQFLEVVDNIYLEYDNKLKFELKKAIDSCTSKEEFKKLSNTINDLEEKITLKHAEICELIIKKNKNLKIDLIGFHGQTILHRPEKGYSIQIGNAKKLYEITKTIVISNFRQNDILNGGQGAPLASLYHHLILLKTKSILPSAVINIGGISNITYSKNQKKIISFDTGPGNYLIDSWVKTNSNFFFDNKGQLAKAGNINNSILKKLLDNTFYNKKIPKSLDVKYFNLNELGGLSLEDGCATLSMLTVYSICNAIERYELKPNKIIFSGGGRKNEFIINNMKKIIKNPIYLIDEFNFDGDFIESQAFAYLAIRTYLKKFISLPETTGVKKPCVGGIIYKG